MLEFMTHPITLTMIACAVAIALYHLYIHVYESAYKLGYKVGKEQILKENLSRTKRMKVDNEKMLQAISDLVPQQ